MIDTTDAVAALDALDDIETEGAHVSADAVLLHIVRFAGYGEVADAYERARDRVCFWYS